MREIENILLEGSRRNEDLTTQFNRERRAIDNAWLFEKVQQGWMPQQAYLRLQIIKDMCEFVYPGLWDIQLEVRQVNFKLQYKAELNDMESDTLQHMGCYFGYETTPEGIVDTYDYYLDSYENSNGDVCYTQSELATTEEPFHTITNAFNTLHFSVIIKFPEATVTTERDGTQHKIRDMFFKLNFAPKVDIIFPYSTSMNVYGPEQIATALEPSYVFMHEGNEIKYHFSHYIFLPRVETARQTVTPREFNVGYLHSHSPVRDREPRYYTLWGTTCCLGEGEIVQIFAMLTADFIPEMVTMLLLQLQTYVSWESKAGGPYIWIHNMLGDTEIQYSGHPQLGMSVKMDYFNILSSLIKNQGKPTDFDTKISNKKMIIIENERFYDFCKLDTDPNCSLYPNSHYPLTLYKTPDGNFISTKIVARDSVRMPVISQDRIDNYPILFQGENHYFRVVPEEAQGQAEAISEGYILNEDIVKYIKNKLETHANHQRYRNDILNRIN